MKKNLFLHKDMVMSEWLLFRLAPVLGRMEAQEKLHALLRRAGEENRSLRELLAADQEIAPLLNSEDMESLDHPERYVGLAVELVDEPLPILWHRRQNDPEALQTMTCLSSRSHIVDSRFYSGGYTTTEARQMFCDLRRLQRWLDVEAALALSQAELGRHSREPAARGNRGNRPARTP
jgi:adenylosuccinate lyase